MKEIWKDVVGYEGYYQVSNLGRVRSVPRRVARDNNGFTRHVDGRVMKGTDNGHGYLIVSLNREGKRKNHYIHRLVAAAFCENPDVKPHINHLDHNRSNNVCSNLEWCTVRENIGYSAHLMRHPKVKAKKSNTGIKYICRTKNKGREVYKVCHKQKRINRHFKTLDEAVSFLEGVVG